MLSTMKPRRSRGEGSKSIRLGKTIEDKYSIKNLIFMPQKPNYVIPVDTEGHKVFLCVDCGDRFVCESSYNYHVNRRSAKITYTCRSCSKTMVYMNRCNLLSHIRSHVLKTATINLVDLKIDPLPTEDMVFGLYHLDESLTIDQVLQKEQLRKQSTETFNDPEENGSDVDVINATDIDAVSSNKKILRKRPRRIRCMECDCLIPYEDRMRISRAKHFMTPDGLKHPCPICVHIAPSSCALKAHIRIHTNYGTNCICPECGQYIRDSFGNHGCEGFRQMRESAFGYCPMQGCDDTIEVIKFQSHFIENHVRPVYKCSLCDTACLTKAAVQVHLQSKHSLVLPDVVEVNLYYQCALCKGRLVLKQCLASHVESHKQRMKSVYPCKNCTFIGKTVMELINHQSLCYADADADTLCLVTKQCTVCKKEITFKCKQSRIRYLPAVCPNKCTSKRANTATVDICRGKITKRKSSGDKSNKTDSIKCPLCSVKLSSEWKYIKMHFTKYHPSHRCIDLKLTITKLNITQKSLKSPTRNKKRRINCTVRGKEKKHKKNKAVELETKEKKVCTEIEAYSMYKCGKCGDISSENAESFKIHILTHRDPSNAYQCMECGCSFAVKPSFCTHLFVAHGIKDADFYIETEKCFNEAAFKADPVVPEEPLKENQCRICREEFIKAEDLDKHFRVHGMAFLMTKKLKK